MRKFMTMMIVALLSIGVVSAQTRLITGTVTDSKGLIVPGATVKVKNGTSVSADDNGQFQINANTGDILIISSIDFGTVSAKVGIGSTINITMATKENKLEEVVVTAQGIRKKSRDIGYSYAKISNEEINVGKSPQLAQALAGKVSGLAVYNVNNSVDPQVKVVLRGYRSLTGNNEALVVLDGMQTTQTVLSIINPNDIENVTVLKGGQAATLYGSAGINGALVITTKKGAKGKLKVAYSSSANFDQISFLPKFQDKYGNGSHYATSFGGSGYKTDYLERMKENWRPFENQQYGDAFNGEERIIGRVLEDGSKNILKYAAIENTRRKAFDIGSTINNQVSFQGGDATSTYYMSLENNKIKGIVPLDKSDRNSVRIASTKEFNRLNVGFTASYVQASYDRTTFDFYNDLINTAANIPLANLRDWRTNKFANPNGYYNDYFNNPYFNKDNNRTKYVDANIQGNFDINYKVATWLSLYNRLGVLNNSRTQKSRTGKFLYTDWAKNDAFVPAPWEFANDYDGIDRAGTDILGAVGDFSGTENVINNEFQLRFDKDFGNFSNKLTLGYSVYQRSTKNISVNSNSIVVPDVYNVSNRQGELTGGEANTLERKYGYYADLTTGYKNWLIINGTFRYDITSRFYKSTRPSTAYSYPYYGVALSFIATDAIPAIKGNLLNYAKLRLNYNKNGNDNIPLYGLDLTYPNGSGFPYGNTVGLTVGNTLPDANLKPEFVTSYEVGGEFQLFKSRVNLDVSAYTQTSKGQVLTVKVPNTTGFSNLLINVGEAKNWGYEADLKVQILQKSRLKWDVGVRYSYNDNKVVDLYPGITQFQLGGFSYANTNVIKDQRFPILRTDGYKYAPDGSGQRLVDPVTGYPLRDVTLSNRGGTLPRHIVGATSRFSYNNFSLAFNFEYRGGNVIYSDIGRQMTFTGAGKWTEERTPHVFPNSAFLDGAGKVTPNTTLNAQESEYELWVSHYRRISENFTTPGWFIKMRDANLTYNFTPKLLSRTKVFSGASISLYGRNLFTIVDKSNFYTDPEFSFTTGNGIGINTTLQTPPVRQYGFNINLTF